MTAVTITNARRSVTFDATISERHESKASVALHEVERGSPVSDHIRSEPYEVMLTVAMTRTPVQGDQEDGRDFRIHSDLIAMREDLLPVSVDTYLGSVDSMAITGVSTPVSAADGDSLTCTVSLIEIRVVESATTAVPEDFIAAIIAADAAPQEVRGRDDAEAESDPEDRRTAATRILDSITGRDQRVDANGDPL